jgi:hypothetical protein
MTEVRYDTKHHAGATPDDRIASRLKNSGDEKHADHHAVHGTGPTRTHTNIFHSGNARTQGQPNTGSPGIDGHKRDTV